MPIGLATAWGAVDALEVEPAGLIRVIGWCAGPASRVDPPVGVEVDDTPAAPAGVLREYRPDVASAATLPNMSGLILQFMAPDAAFEAGRVKWIRVRVGEDVVEHRVDKTIVRPPYQHLLGDVAVHHREQIYGSGPPQSEVAAFALALARELPGPILDFGCGGGALVAAFRAAGIEAWGTDLDTAQLREGIVEPARAHVTLYPGGALPFEDGRFKSLTAIEVLEHIPDYEDALDEICRVTAESALFTVPDMSAIPLLHPQSVVPWHLLEGTHVNFFNHGSLRRLLEKYFDVVEIGQAAPVRVNDSRFYTHLVASCHGPRRASPRPERSS